MTSPIQKKYIRANETAYMTRPIQKKYIRANETAYVMRLTKKAIIHRNKLKNKFIKNQSKENEIRYKKQRNSGVSMISNKEIVLYLRYETKK